MSCKVGQNCHKIGLFALRHEHNLCKEKSCIEKCLPRLERCRGSLKGEAAAIQAEQRKRRLGETAGTTLLLHRRLHDAAVFVQLVVFLNDKQAVYFYSLVQAFENSTAGIPPKNKFSLCDCRTTFVFFEDILFLSFFLFFPTIFSFCLLKTELKKRSIQGPLWAGLPPA